MTDRTTLHALDVATAVAAEHAAHAMNSSRRLLELVAQVRQLSGLEPVDLQGQAAIWADEAEAATQSRLSS